MNDDEKFFVIAHEIMHIKFMHMYRLTDKEGNKRDRKLWNIATDAIINANLERDGFIIKGGFVNMPEALKYSAEEFYEILLQEKEKYQSSLQGDDHSLWEEAFRNQQEQKQEDNRKQQTDSKEKKQDSEGQTITSFNEKSEFEDNRQEKRKRFKDRRERTEYDIRGIQERIIEFDNIGESKETIDWKALLRREIEKTETFWSQRRSIAENNYAYRPEENDIEDEAETEIIIDVSGSVDLNLVKAFLRQIKPILRQSKLKVGCFNEKFWGLKDIQNVRDIDNFTIPEVARGSSAWTEDWDLAVRSFTKKREINKIIFTDGYPCTGVMPKEDLKRENVIWLVYGNKNFYPCCGKVINITEKQLEKLHQIDISSTLESVNR